MQQPSRGNRGHRGLPSLPAVACCALLSAVTPAAAPSPSPANVNRKCLSRAGPATMCLFSVSPRDQACPLPACSSWPVSNWICPPSLAPICLTLTFGAARDRPVTSGAGEPPAGLSDQHLWSCTGVQGALILLKAAGMAPCTTPLFSVAMPLPRRSHLYSPLCTVQAFADLLANASKVSNATRCSYLSQAQLTT